ncbi:hypothetical protein EVAR_48299_1 [Eumeta japonica]|uniref:Uncharacterized protein n=1 Tax=Eumeta variegata TaxID=151549 RepID=A0A4C1WJQ9_EUMVA|nr:hypothetical protein EVAR_48299_1 [Eumeta japonica]
MMGGDHLLYVHLTVVTATVRSQKRQQRLLFTTGLQDSNTVVSFLVTNLLIALLTPKQRKHRPNNKNIDAERRMIETARHLGYY